jgi:hypothetical protein
LWFAPTIVQWIQSPLEIALREFYSKEAEEYLDTHLPPELRADSRYNQDNAYITAHYALSSDQFALIVKTSKEPDLAQHVGTPSLDEIRGTVRRYGR